MFTLPPEMIGFYKAHIEFLSRNAVTPDKRRYAVEGEAPRHFIDLDAYPDTTCAGLPRHWPDAVARFGEDSLALHGIVPWHIQLVKFQLTEAFRVQDPDRILKLSADLGHYIADANVPLHTTRNYNGQLTGQQGIHGLWESRLPELLDEEYDFFTGPADYLASPQKTAWKAVFNAHAALDSVLRIEKELTLQYRETEKYSFEERNGQTIKVYSEAFSRRYHQQLAGQVERRMRAAVKMVGDFWYTAWVDAGQPDLNRLTDFRSSGEDRKKEESEPSGWLRRLFQVREESN
ncbi:zinc dependent phospholipase C family protein [Larkinella soli]|uniref:zinc dependent phospholipase C family protein n=1 Tax=Larkinella soli TaxID=1770527 RepID=UPI0035B5EA7A